MYDLHPLIAADAYKLSHWRQYGPEITMVYSNFTPRRSRWPGQDRFVFFGLQAFLIKLRDYFQRNFFEKDEAEAVAEFAGFYKSFFGREAAPEDLLRVSKLWQLGYIPLQIRALPEGTAVPHNVPCFTISNTHKDFPWMTNFVESWMSCEIWQVGTSATTAFYYRKSFEEAAKISSDSPWFVPFQGHDFSFRGLAGLNAAASSGAAHLLSFLGTDTLPAIRWIEKNYYKPGQEHGMLGTSVPATEHSVMCAGTQEDELETYRRLITEVYPGGIVSIVSDTWDFWRVVTEYLPQLKSEIMARKDGPAGPDSPGKVVIRPDSSPKTPYEIICGDPDAPKDSPEYKGLNQCLYEIFGGTKNSKGYIDLDPHIGWIYGDSITLDLQHRILQGLMDKGFASTNGVFGIGSYTYQYVTRDTHGIAIKATAVGSDGPIENTALGQGWDENFKIIPIFKDPKTDKSGKKSAMGLLAVERRGLDYILHQNVPHDYSGPNELQPVWRDGDFIKFQTFDEIKAVLEEHLSV